LNFSIPGKLLINTKTLIYSIHLHPITTMQPHVLGTRIKIILNFAHFQLENAKRYQKKGDFWHFSAQNMDEFIFIYILKYALRLEVMKGTLGSF